MITVDYKSRQPLYEQIIERVENLALLGLLPPDSQLPSVRQLAAELSINPNTIQRAYGDLEKRGVIYSLPGRGSFVAARSEELRERKKQALWEDLQKLIDAAGTLGVSRDDFAARSAEYFALKEQA
ncbi:MAG: GntR family transcriptional regulator [Gracilibacteraceae bacterium]|nr:GntR family transcriptional regulator [Gracilibacteraceae bacterium]